MKATEQQHSNPSESHWIIIAKAKAAELAAKHPRSSEFFEKLIETGNANPDNYNYLVVPDGDELEEGASIRATQIALEDVVDSTVDQFLKHSVLTPEKQAARKRALIPCLALQAIDLVHASTRYYMREILENEGIEKLRPIRAGTALEELDESEAEIVTCLLDTLQQAIQKQGYEARDVYKVFLDGELKKILPGSQELWEYECLPRPKKAHARSQVIRLWFWSTFPALS